MNSPLVSIIIPAHNRESLIGASIESALDQTVRDFEVVIVDNASTDGTWQVCQSYAAKDKRVRVFRDPVNIGPVRNWQRCIQEARGQYGKILFSDDLIEPSFLEQTLRFMDDPEVGFVFTAARVGSQPGQGTVAHQITSKAGIVQSKEFIEAALFGSNIPVSPGCALFRMHDLRRNLMIEIPSPSIHDFPDHGAGPDLLLYLLTAGSYPTVAHVPEPLAFFRSHPSSITVSRGSEYIWRRYQQARIWFAKEHLDQTSLQQLCTLTWLKVCKQRRSWVSPQQALHPFLEATAWSLSTNTVVSILSSEIRRKAKKAFVRFPNLL
jgi:glycosyltransferase involved in cell wall biosynthesis